MKEKDYLITRELRKRVSLAAKIVDFRVFGSRARGDEDEYSDMDIFIEVEMLNQEIKEKISTIVWEVGFEYYTLISPLIFTRNEIEKSPLRASPIVRNIMAEGIAV